MRTRVLIRVRVVFRFKPFFLAGLMLFFRFLGVLSVLCFRGFVLARFRLLYLRHCGLYLLPGVLRLTLFVCGFYPIGKSLCA